MKTSEPNLKCLQGPLSSNIVIGEQAYLYFSGTAYLGIPQNDAFISLYLEGLKKFGLNNGTSRGNNVQLGIYNEAEQYASEYFGTEAALISSSGYLAAQMLVRHFTGYGIMLYAPHTHPALWLGGVPAVNETYSNWTQRTVDQINESKETKWVLVSNSLNNLFPERYDFSFLEAIRAENEIILIVDDSHGIGVLNDGKGVLNLISAPKHVKTVVVASMAKALGVDAGLIIGSKDVIENLKKGNEFIGASPPAAAGLYAFMGAAQIYRNELDKLHQLMRVFSSGINPDEWDFIEDYPVYLSKDETLYAKLLQHNMLISSFPYPNHNGPALNRVVLSSWASTESIHALLKAIAAQKECP